MTLLWSIVFQSIQQEGCSLLNHALRLEDVYNAIDVNQRAALVICELSCKFSPFLWRNPNLWLRVC